MGRILSNIREIDNLDFYIISYATLLTPYERVLTTHLLDSIKRLEKPVPYYIELIDNLGDWTDNTAYKSRFILKCLENNMCNNLIFLDADATIEQYPNLFTEIPKEYDIACHLLDWQTWYGHTNVEEKELLTGTMLFRPKKIVLDLVWEWSEEVKKTREWEQKVLQRIIKKYDIKIFELPLSYCYIKTLPDGSEPKIKIDSPTIVHHQVSRTLKKTLKLYRNMRHETKF